MFNNPLRFIDPDGMESFSMGPDGIDTMLGDRFRYWNDLNNEWIPTINDNRLTLIAEQGDNAKTLAAFLNVNQKKADKLYRSMDKSGNITLPDDIPGVSAINATIADVKANPDNNSNSFFAKITMGENTNYNCFGCALVVANGKAPNFSKALSTSTFDRTVSGFSEAKDGQGLKFGKSVISFAEKSWTILEGTTITTKHAATYLGASKDGTQYTWSKSGLYATPKIQTVPQLKREYGRVVNYYNKR